MKKFRFKLTTQDGEVFGDVWATRPLRAQIEVVKSAVNRGYSHFKVNVIQP